MGTAHNSEQIKHNNSQFRGDMTQEISFNKRDIGGELLPILTTGLYSDALDTLREYIQNSIDANASKIDLRIDSVQIVITDDGRGMNLEQARKAIRLGISDKNPTKNVGFRGIGIYSSFNLCDKVEIFTKAQHDETYVISFDFEKIKTEILKEQERRKKNLPPELFLEKLLSDNVKINVSVDFKIKNESGTKVILSGLLGEVYKRLNDWDEVSNYLENVVPLPFSTDFKFSSKIEQKLKQKDYNTVALFLQIGDRTEELLRPYNNDLFHFGGNHDVKFFELGDDENHYGFAWICLNDARAVLKNKSMRGLLIKKFGFSLSNRNFLEHYFPRPVFYRRLTGEIIIQHENLIPNAARSDFEYNSYRQSFFQYIPTFIDNVSKWANRIQEEDLAKDVLAEVMNKLTSLNETLLQIRRDKEQLLIENNNLQNIERDLNSQRKTLAKIAPEEYKKAESLLSNCRNFIRKELIQKSSTAKSLENRIADSIVAKKNHISEEERKRLEKKPKKIFDLIESFGYLKVDEYKKVLAYIDNNIMLPYLSEEDYVLALEQVQIYLEENS